MIAPRILNITTYWIRKLSTDDIHSGGILYSQLSIRECSNLEYPHFWNVGTEERIWYPPKFIQILRFADIRFQNTAQAPVTAHGLIFYYFLITIHGACTARVRAGLGQVMHCTECPSVSDLCDNGVHEPCWSTGPLTSKVTKTNSRGVGNGWFLVRKFSSFLHWS